jgi:hypothetical protein
MLYFSGKSVELVEDDEGSQHVDRYTGCESSSGIYFDSRVKVRSPAKSDLVLHVGVPRVPKYYAVQRGYKQGVFFLWSECECHMRGVSTSEFKSFRSYQEALQYLR